MRNDGHSCTAHSLGVLGKACMHRITFGTVSAPFCRKAVLSFFSASSDGWGAGLDHLRLRVKRLLATIPALTTFYSEKHSY